MNVLDIPYWSCLVLICLLCVQGISAAELIGESGESPGGGATGLESGRAAMQMIANIPLFFVPNEGQADPAVLFTCNGEDSSLFFTKDRVVYSLPIDGGYGRTALAQRFSGGNPEPVVEGIDPLETRVSYFKGDESEWHTNITPFSAIVYRSVYPGIDVVYRGEKGTVKRELLVSPGADPNRIRMTCEGAGQVRMAGDGGLVIRAGSGEIRETAPVCYQEVDGIRIEIPCRFDVRDDGSASFYVGAYDHSLPLMIDPALAYCGYIGGEGTDEGNGIAVDAAGNAYVTGTTTSTEATFPVYVGPDTTHNEGNDAFVAKVNAAGTGLTYCGYIGGEGTDEGNGIAVDAAGNAYVTGTTSSTEATFPVYVGPDTIYNGGHYDAFMAKVNATGTGLTYCGYIGGSGNDYGKGIAVDTVGNAYVTGYTDSTEDTFPVYVNPDLIYNGGMCDAFIAKVYAAGNGFTYCGYIGGSGEDWGSDIAVDAAGNAYVAGTTSSTEATFPETIGPDLSYNDGSNDAFVARVNLVGMRAYCGYIGGSDDDSGYGIAVDSEGNAYVTGSTDSNRTEGFPVYVGPDTTFNGGPDAFVAKVNAAGTELIYCGYIGGSWADYGEGIAVDTAGNAYVTGNTLSTDATFPENVGPDLTHNGAYDAFVTKVNTAGTGFTYCGYIGGSGFDYGEGIAVDAAGNAYVTGNTASSQTEGFPVYVGPDTTHNGGTDVFVAKVNPAHMGVLRASTWYNWILTNDLISVANRDHYGIASDKPLLGDFNNDGILDRGVFRNGDWILDYFMDGSVNSNTHFGVASDIPLVFDFNNDGIADRAVFRESAWDNWILDYSMDGSTNTRNRYGTTGDIPLIGDFNNDGIADRAVFRGSAWDNWILDYSMDGSTNTRNHYGQAGDIPVVGDFNGDGIHDRAVFRSGEWIIDYTMDGSINSRPRFGTTGDLPLAWNR